MSVAIFQNVIQVQLHGSKTPVVLYQEMWMQMWLRVNKLLSAAISHRFNFQVPVLKHETFSRKIEKVRRAAITWKLGYSNPFFVPKNYTIMVWRHPLPVGKLLGTSLFKRNWGQLLPSFPTRLLGLWKMKQNLETWQFLKTGHRVRSCHIGKVDQNSSCYQRESRSQSTYSQDLDLVLNGWRARHWPKMRDVTFSSQNVTFQVR